MRNPITGLGPAAYRSYAAMKPLSYGRCVLARSPGQLPQQLCRPVRSRGPAGPGDLPAGCVVEVIGWVFAYELASAAGFAAGYVNAMLAAWAGALVLMLFADWILPLVYNIGFPGFQASVLVWLFLGGLVALEQMAGRRGLNKRKDVPATTCALPCSP